MQGAGDKLQITECQGFLYKKWAGAGEWGGVDWRDGGGRPTQEKGWMGHDCLEVPAMDLGL